MLYCHTVSASSTLQELMSSGKRTWLQFSIRAIVVLTSPPFMDEIPSPARQTSSAPRYHFLSPPSLAGVNYAYYVATLYLLYVQQLPNNFTRTNDLHGISTLLSVVHVEKQLQTADINYQPGPRQTVLQSRCSISRSPCTVCGALQCEENVRLAMNWEVLHQIDTRAGRSYRKMVITAT